MLIVTAEFGECVSFDVTCQFVFCVLAFNKHSHLAVMAFVLFIVTCRLEFFFFSINKTHCLTISLLEKNVSRHQSKDAGII
jgi:hypothetical protein